YSRDRDATSGDRPRAPRDRDATADRPRYSRDRDATSGDRPRAPRDRGAPGDRPRFSRDRDAAPIEPAIPKPIRKVRSEHGTRVARSITCSSCGQRDTIHFAPKDPKRALCRRCAADQLGALDPDTNVLSERPFVCAECGRQGVTTKVLAPGADFVCNDCLRGIASKQEDKTKTATRLSKKVLRVRRPDPTD
ncbi:hypothetical protein L6R52_09660, partial [Myxococcota bacterium]|nr:hypothetical protein [Myxococcota bacterium]